jgi:hypothetical protein
MKAGVLGTLTPVIATTYDPWWAQRMFHRSRAAVRVIVAGRQSGKTHAAAREVVQIMLARPKTTSCLLMPILKTSTGTQTHVRNALEEALGSEGGRWTWHEQKKCWTLWNGSVLHLRCIDTDAKKGVAVRGLTIDGVLWVDEAAYVPKSAWESACATQLAVTDPLAIVTTTPCGMNWVYEEFQAGTPGQGKKPSNESFRFRSSDSPFVKAAKLAEMRERYGQKRADQEINAVFFGDGGTVFPLEHIHRMLVPVLEHRGEQWTLGIDLAKERDFTVVTIMNEFGEAWIRWRVRHTDWPKQQQTIVDIARDLSALCVVDVGHGGGYGGMMCDYLIAELGESQVLKVRTGNRGVKAQIIETLASDLEADRIRMESGEFLEQIVNEMKFFEGHRHIVGGSEIWVFGRPGSRKKKTTEDEDEENDDHDDIVMSLALANWGRTHGWSRDTGDGGIGSFRKPTKPAGGFGRRHVRPGGYIFKSTKKRAA